MEGNSNSETAKPAAAALADASINVLREAALVEVALVDAAFVVFFIAVPAFLSRFACQFLDRSALYQETAPDS